MLSIPQKQCSRCKQYYPHASFYNDKNSKDGLKIYCKKCIAEKRGRVWHPECLMPDGYRQCGHCAECLPMTQEYFNRNKNCKDGWSNKCKSCSQKYDAQWLDDNREINRERSKERYYAKPEARKKYHDDNLEHILQHKREYRKSHPEITRKHKRDSSRRMRENHPEIVKLRSRISSMRRRVTMGTITRSELMVMYEEQEHRCAYCGITIFWSIPNDLHVDHIRPVTKGGTNDIENLALTCADCNLSKHDLMLDEWVRVRGW